MPEMFDFGGYATKNDLKCQDGRTIRKGAFKDCDGKKVPLVWSHRHDGPGSVLGHAILENRDDGVYTYGTFNETDAGKNAKELVRHGDVRALSIYANNLVQKGGDVLHGMIREVSLCLSGANPGARIEELSIEHNDDDDSDMMEALIFNGENVEIAHSDDVQEVVEDNRSVEEVFHAMTEDQQEAAYQVIGQALNHSDEPLDDTIMHSLVSMNDIERDVVSYMVGQALEHAEKSEEEIKMADTDNRTVQDVFDGMSEEEKNVVYYMIGQALENNANSEEDGKMAHNVFEGDTYENSLAHAMEVNEALKAVVADGEKYGTLKKSLEHHMAENEVLAHAVDTTGMTVPELTNQQYAQSVGYGINGIEMLYPEARTINNVPEFIRRSFDWVNVVEGGVHKSPFSRVKSIFANITEDEARAKGYIKGNLKKNEFFSLMKRETLPQTIYKRQKFDRDDIIDITDMNVVSWVKGEMNEMLREEKARAILIGDGRDVNDPDKIKETNIRPIVSDVDLFTIKVVVTPGQDDEETAKNMIKANLRARKQYKGSGNPVMFTTEDNLTSMLLLEDGIGRRLYNTEAELAAANRVRTIVTVPVMEGYKNASNQDLMAIIVNLNDYNVGADKGGAVEMFDDFNIDYNQFIYLIETRMSGALIKPYSAIALFKGTAQQNP